MKILDERTLLSRIKRGERILFLKDVRLTPAAQDLVRRHRLTIVPEEDRYIPASEKVQRLAVGADHGGYPLKQVLIDRLKRSGFTVLDLGTDGEASVDYPDFALAVAKAVAEGRADRGVMIDSIGVASAMVANKVRGVRAAPCWSVEVARSARSHNDANLITLGGKTLSPDAAWEVLQAFLSEPFSGGRHERRVRKIEAVSKV